MHRIRQIRMPNAPFSCCGRLVPKGPSSQLTVLLIEVESKSRETQRIDLYVFIRSACRQRGARSLRNVLIDSDMHFMVNGDALWSQLRCFVESMKNLGESNEDAFGALLIKIVLTLCVTQKRVDYENKV